MTDRERNLYIMTLSERDLALQTIEDLKGFYYEDRVDYYDGLSDVELAQEAEALI